MYYNITTSVVDYFTRLRWMILSKDPPPILGGGGFGNSYCRVYFGGRFSVRDQIYMQRYPMRILSLV
jgi:hypothetical protein